MFSYVKGNKCFPCRNSERQKLISYCAWFMQLGTIDCFAFECVIFLAEVSTNTNTYRRNWLNLSSFVLSVFILQTCRDFSCDIKAIFLFSLSGDTCKVPLCSGSSKYQVTARRNLFNILKSMHAELILYLCGKGIKYSGKEWKF